MLEPWSPTLAKNSNLHSIDKLPKAWTMTEQYKVRFDMPALVPLQPTPDCH